MTIKHWLREPLVHFLLGGLALFAFFTWRGEPADPASRTIAISLEQQAQLALQFQRTMQRPPTDAELENLVQQYVREEILYREALRLGLDTDDAVIRKRLSQKMDYLAEGAAQTERPNEETLQQWLEDNPARFAPDSRYSFDQLWFADLSAAEGAKAAMDRGENWQELGDQISLPRSRDSVTSADIETQFGREFLSNIEGLGAGEGWSEPLRSGFGFHLVRLRETKSGEAPALSEIREKVEANWRSETLARRRADAYQILRDGYQVTLEK